MEEARQSDEETLLATSNEQSIKPLAATNISTNDWSLGLSSAVRGRSHGATDDDNHAQRKKATAGVYKRTDEGKQSGSDSRYEAGVPHIVTGATQEDLGSRDEAQASSTYQSENFGLLSRSLPELNQARQETPETQRLDSSESAASVVDQLSKVFLEDEETTPKQAVKLDSSSRGDTKDPKPAAGPTTSTRDVQPSSATSYSVSAGSPSTIKASRTTAPAHRASKYTTIPTSTQQQLGTTSKSQSTKRPERNVSDFSFTELARSKSSDEARFKSKEHTSPTGSRSLSPGDAFRRFKEQARRFSSSIVSTSSAATESRNQSLKSAVASKLGMTSMRDKMEGAMADDRQVTRQTARTGRDCGIRADGREVEVQNRDDSCREIGTKEVVAGTTQDDSRSRHEAIGGAIHSLNSMSPRRVRHVTASNISSGESWTSDLKLKRKKTNELDSYLHSYFQTERPINMAPPEGIPEEDEIVDKDTVVGHGVQDAILEAAPMYSHGAEGETAAASAQYAEDSDLLTDESFQVAIQRSLMPDEQVMQTEEATSQFTEYLESLKSEPQARVEEHVGCRSHDAAVQPRSSLRRAGYQYEEGSACSDVAAVNTPEFAQATGALPQAQAAKESFQIYESNKELEAYQLPAKPESRPHGSLAKEIEIITDWTKTVRDTEEKFGASSSGDTKGPKPTTSPPRSMHSEQTSVSTTTPSTRVSPFTSEPTRDILSSAVSLKSSPAVEYIASSAHAQATSTGVSSTSPTGHDDVINPADSPDTAFAQSDSTAQKYNKEEEATIQARTDERGPSRLSLQDDYFLGDPWGPLRRAKQNGGPVCILPQDLASKVDMAPIITVPARATETARNDLPSASIPLCACTQELMKELGLTFTPVSVQQSTLRFPQPLDPDVTAAIARSRSPKGPEIRVSDFSSNKPTRRARLRSRSSDDVRLESKDSLSPSWTSRLSWRKKRSSSPSPDAVTGARKEKQARSWLAAGSPDRAGTNPRRKDSKEHPSLTRSRSVSPADAFRRFKKKAKQIGSSLVSTSSSATENYKYSIEALSTGNIETQDECSYKGSSVKDAKRTQGARSSSVTNLPQSAADGSLEAEETVEVDESDKELIAIMEEWARILQASTLAKKM